MHLDAHHSLPGWLYRLAEASWPYIAIVILLPGGSMLALVLWLYRRIRALKKFDHEDMS